jgi:hypothetical protein
LTNLYREPKCVALMADQLNSINLIKIANAATREFSFDLEDKASEVSTSDQDAPTSEWRSKNGQQILRFRQ